VRKHSKKETAGAKPLRLDHGTSKELEPVVYEGRGEDLCYFDCGYMVTHRGLLKSVLSLFLNSQQ
jgi:hypothetical protein